MESAMGLVLLFKFRRPLSYSRVSGPLYRLPTLLVQSAEGRKEGRKSEAGAAQQLRSAQRHAELAERSPGGTVRPAAILIPFFHAEQKKKKTSTPPVVNSCSIILR